MTLSFPGKILLIGALAACLAAPPPSASIKPPAPTR